jgi:hypothetical protein
LLSEISDRRTQQEKSASNATYSTPPGSYWHKNTLYMGICASIVLMPVIWISIIPMVVRRDRADNHNVAPSKQTDRLATKTPPATVAVSGNGKRADKTRPAMATVSGNEKKAVPRQTAKREDQGTQKIIVTSTSRRKSFKS